MKMKFIIFLSVLFCMFVTIPVCANDDDDDDARERKTDRRIERRTDRETDRMEERRDSAREPDTRRGERTTDRRIERRTEREGERMEERRDAVRGKDRIVNRDVSEQQAGGSQEGEEIKGEGKELYDENSQQRRDLLRTFDLDGDGRISREEMEEANAVLDSLSE